LARREFAEAIKTAASPEDKAFLRQQKKRFFAGEAVPGVIGRHPNLGPYSIQPVMYKLARTPYTRSQEYVRVGDELRQFETGIGKLESNLSPMFGMAADRDDDRLVTRFMGTEKTAQAVEGLIKNGHLAKQYERFVQESATFQQLAKSHVPPGVIQSTLEETITGAATLRSGAADIGSVSAAIAEAKIAVGHYRPEMAGRFNVMAELLEQTVVGSAVARQRYKMGENTAQRLSDALYSVHTGSPQELESLTKITRDLFGTEVEKGIDVAGQELKVNFQDMWRNAAEALREGREKGGVVRSWRQLARGRSIGTSSQELGSMLEHLRDARAGKADVLTNLAMGIAEDLPGSFTSHSRKTLGKINRSITEAGRALKPFAKPALIGLGVMAGAFMLMGAPKPSPMTVGPPGKDHGGTEFMGTRLSLNMLQGGPSSTKDMRPESYSTPQSVSGSPTPPYPIGASPQTYVSNQESMSSKISVSGGTSRPPSQSNLSSLLSRLAPGRQSSVNYTDKRGRMTPDEIENILEGY